MADHPDSPLIDGALPRSGSDRVSVLLGYARTLVDEAGENVTTARALRLNTLAQEALSAERQEISVPPLVHPENEWEHWHELENDVIDLVNDLLPSPWYMTLHPDDPGTVVIWDETEEGEE